MVQTTVDSFAGEAGFVTDLRELDGVRDGLDKNDYLVEFKIVDEVHKLFDFLVALKLDVILF